MANSPWCRTELTEQGRLGPVARLMPTTAATTLRKDKSAAGARRSLRRDQGAAARLLCGRVREPRRGARRRARPRRGQPGGAYEIRPVGVFLPDAREPRCATAVSDTAWIDAALTAARPQAVGALLRYFRDLDTAEEAFQDACLRALKTWPQNGPPRDPAAWLIMVGRNAAIDDIRRRRKQEPLPEDEAISDLDDAEDAAGRAARRLALPRRHAAPAVHLLPSRPAGDAADRAGAAHRLGPHGEADRPRLPGRRSGDGAAHHPRQGAHRRRRRAVRDAGRGGARRAARRGRGDDLSDLQRGLFGQRRHRRNPRAAVRRGDPAGAAAAAAVPDRAGDHGADGADAAAACPRRGAVRRRRRDRAARRPGPRRCGTGR